MAGAPLLDPATGLPRTSSAVGNVYTFTGREFDAETGLMHFRARTYAPKLGRFIQRDPAGFADGMNLYEFVRSRPTAGGDASGAVATFAEEEGEAAAQVETWLKAAGLNRVQLWRMPGKRWFVFCDKDQAWQQAYDKASGVWKNALWAAAHEDATYRFYFDTDSDGIRYLTRRYWNARFSTEESAGAVAAHRLYSRNFIDPSDAQKEEYARLDRVTPLKPIAAGLAEYRRRAFKAIEVGETIDPELAQTGRNVVWDTTGHAQKAADIVREHADDTQTWFTIGLAIADLREGVQQQVRIGQSLITVSRRGVPVYRVQGGMLPKASKVRFGFNDAGKLRIFGDDMLHVNVNHRARALEFLARRGEGAYIVEFRVKEAFVEKLRRTAVRQAVAREFPGRPQLVDLRIADQFGIPSNMFKELLDSVELNSVRLILQ